MKQFLTALAILISITSFAQKQEIKVGDKYFEDERYSRALHYYLQAYQELPSDTYVNMRLAQCYVELFDANKALKHINKAIEFSKKPSNEMIFCKAQAYHLGHKFGYAIELYKESDPGKVNIKEVSKKIQECEYGIKYTSNPTGAKVLNMGELINSPEDDVLPKITADRSKMYFTSKRAGSTGGRMNPEDIYVSINKGGAWSKPGKVSSLCTENNDGCVGLSPDGHEMYLFMGSNGGDVFESSLKGDNWTKPQPMFINTEDKESTVTLSPDGNKLYFVRKPKGGQSDIYIVQKNYGGKWIPPRRLPSTINTPYDEESPFMHPDGKTLYFSSKGHTSMGGYDIFKSELQPNGSWSKPENLGSPINTAGDDFCFVLSANGQWGYYSSAMNGGFGKQDLYTIRMPLASRDHELSLLKGKVEEEFTHKPIEADITITDNDAGEVVAQFKSNSKTGEYLVSLPAGKNYGITIEKAGHLFHSENVYLPEGKGFVELNKDVKLVNIKPGSKVVLNNIFFDVGKYTIQKTSYPELNKVRDLLKSNPNMVIEISGHTDNTGDPAANLKLSEQRAKAVVEYLVSKGVPALQLEYKGYGSSKPIADNSTASGRQKNRRTEFEIKR